MVGIAVMFALLGQALLCASEVSLSRFNHFVKVPSDAIHTSGRLTERHIAYIAQAGYKSLVSLATFSSNDTSYNGVQGSFPSTNYELALAQSYGMEAQAVPMSFTAKFAHQISDILSALPQPVFLHCYVGYSATLFVETHLYLTGQIPGEAILPNGINYGLDFQADPNAVKMINSLTGLDYKTQSPILEKPLAQGEQSYTSYFWTHRTGHDDYWYNSGQVLDTDPNAIKTAGYATVICMREDGEPTIHLPSDPATGPVDNNEFSDANGNYNSTAERAAFEAVGVNWVYSPLGSNADSTLKPVDWTAEKYNEYKPAMQAAEAAGPVLTHCQDGYRSAAYSMAYVAQKAGKCTDWAVQEAKYIGFAFDTPDNVQIVTFFKDVLKC